jgi:hypothetical protein
MAAYFTRAAAPLSAIMEPTSERLDAGLSIVLALPGEIRSSTMLNTGELWVRALSQRSKSAGRL